MFSEIVRYRGLLAMLAWRDIRVRYKQSLMGVAWAFLMPLIQTAVLFSIFKYGGVIKPDQLGIQGPYLLFVLSGVIPWTFTAAGVNMSIESLTRNSRLVTKIYFPREVFPLGSVTASLVDLGIASLVIIPVYIYYLIYRSAEGAADIHLTATVFFVPLILLVQALFVGGLAMILSMANLFFRDVKYIMTFVIQLWFFATNVMYPIKFRSMKSLEWVIHANPMIPILESYRDAMLYGHMSNLSGLLISGIIALAVFLGGWTIFHRMEFKFAEYI